MDNNSKDKNTPEVGDTEIIFDKKRTPDPDARTIKVERGSTKTPESDMSDDETIIYDIEKVRKAQEEARAANSQQGQRPQRPVAPQRRPPQRPASQNTPVSDGENAPAPRPAAQKPIPPQSISPQSRPVREDYEDDTPRGVKSAADVSDRPVVRVAEKREKAPAKSKSADVKSDAAAGADKKAVKLEKKQKAKAEKTEGGAATTVLSVVWAVLYIVFVIVSSIFLGFGIIFAGNDIFAFVKEDVEISVEIPEYATLNEVAEIFYDEGLIQYKAIFKMWSQLRDKDNAAEFVAGTHVVSPAMNYDELRAALRPIYKREIVRITIPEGFTTDEIIDLFVEQGISTKEKFIDAINNYDFKEAGYEYWFLDELNENGISPDRFYRLDGYLFPDTYDFYTTSSAATVIAKLLDNFSYKYNETFRARAAELNMTTDELINLAALVEKEARFIVDFANISSVFHNRLNNPSNFPRLQSDATTIYAIHHNTGIRPTTLTGADLTYESPYNSHENAGLPPGPIANPGLEAIKYALYPDATNYYFFVSSDAGNTYFGTTNAEHEKNKALVAVENNAS